MLRDEVENNPSVINPPPRIVEVLCARNGPLTESRIPGEVVPIPTLPESVMTNLLTPFASSIYVRKVLAVSPDPRTDKAADGVAVAMPTKPVETMPDAEVVL